MENNIYKQNYKLVHIINSFSVVLISRYSEINLNLDISVIYQCTVPFMYGGREGD